MAVVIVLWILCGVLAAVIASSKGGSGGLGFLVGFLLGPFGIILAFFMGDDQAKAASEVAAGTSKKCPRCAELVKPEALVCRFCGNEFATAPGDGQPVAPGA